jgi:hypothetical protein
MLQKKGIILRLPKKNFLSRRGYFEFRTETIQTHLERIHAFRIFCLIII